MNILYKNSDFSEEYNSISNHFDATAQNQNPLSDNQPNFINADPYEIEKCYNTIQENEDELSVAFAFYNLLNLLAHSQNPGNIFSNIHPIHLEILLHYIENDCAKKSCLEILGKFIDYIQLFDEPPSEFLDVLQRNDIFGHLYNVITHISDEETFNLCLFCLKSCQKLDILRNTLFASNIYDGIKSLQVTEKNTYLNITKLFLNALNSTFDEPLLNFFHSNIDFILNLAFIKGFDESNCVALEGLGTFFTNHPETASLFETNAAISFLGDHLENKYQAIRHAAGRILLACANNPALLGNFYKYNIICALFERFDWDDTEHILISIQTLQKLAVISNGDLFDQFITNLIQKKGEIIGLHFKVKNEMIPLLYELIKHLDQEKIQILLNNFELVGFLLDGINNVDDNYIRMIFEMFLTMCLKCPEMAPLICESVLNEEIMFESLVDDKTNGEFVQTALNRMKEYLPSE